MKNERFVEIFELEKAYPNPFGEAISVVKGFNLMIPKGDFVSIIGHSGCGKSTVLTMIAGLNAITSGGIIVDGKEINESGPDRAVVFQSPCLMPWMTAYQNVKLGVDNVYPHATKQQRRLVTEYALSVVGLGDAMHKYPREMSGGMQQRVGVARAIALKPKVLLLDEPFGRLDSLTRMELQDVVLDILDKEKITTVMITHDPDEAVYMSDKIVMMTNGPCAHVGEVINVAFPRPRDRHELMESDAFFEYRRQLLQFLDDCELEKDKLAAMKHAQAQSSQMKSAKKSAAA